jgi:predicted enzyme related to lactoylglutathione lyase
MKLRLAMIFVKDVERMKTFYRDALGLAVREADSTPTWIELDAGGATVALHAIPSDVAAQIAIDDPPKARSDTPIKLVFECDDVEAARARIVEHGGTMFEVNAWGACDGLDPEGNVLQITKR